jgi:hypothetical protein
MHIFHKLFISKTTKITNAFYNNPINISKLDATIKQTKKQDLSVRRIQLLMWWHVILCKQSMTDDTCATYNSFKHYLIHEQLNWIKIRACDERAIL